MSDKQATPKPATLVYNFRRTGGRATGVAVEVRCVPAVPGRTVRFPAPAGAVEFDWRPATEDEVRVSGVTI